MHKIKRVKNHVMRHRVKYIVIPATAVTAVVVLALSENVNSMSEFLTEKGLYDEWLHSA